MRCTLWCVTGEDMRKTTYSLGYLTHQYSLQEMVKTWYSLSISTANAPLSSFSWWTFMSVEQREICTYGGCFPGPVTRLDRTNYCIGRVTMLSTSRKRPMHEAKPLANGRCVWVMF